MAVKRNWLNQDRSIVRRASWPEVYLAIRPREGHDDQFLTEPTHGLKRLRFVFRIRRIMAVIAAWAMTGSAIIVGRREVRSAPDQSRNGEAWRYEVLWIAQVLLVRSHWEARYPDLRQNVLPTVQQTSSIRREPQAIL